MDNRTLTFRGFWNMNLRQWVITCICFERNTVLRNVGAPLPIKSASHPRRTEFSAVPPRKTQKHWWHHHASVVVVVVAAAVLCVCVCVCVCARARVSQFQPSDHFNDLHGTWLLSYATESNITSTKLITKADCVQNHSISAASFNSSNTFHAVPPNWSKIVLILTVYSSRICNIVLSYMMWIK
jgi:hypothetical protein